MVKSKKVTKPKNLEVKSAFILGHHGVNEIGRYRKNEPCVFLNVWCGSGYINDSFVVWGCGSLEDALEIFGATAQKKKWKDLYFTANEYLENKKESMKSQLSEFVESDALSESATDAVIEYAKNADPWIGNKLNELIDAVENCRVGKFDELPDYEYSDESDANSVRKYVETYFIDIDQREVIVNYVNTALECVIDAKKFDDGYYDEYYGYTYIDTTRYGGGCIYIRSENLDGKVFESGKEMIRQLEAHNAAA
jgi:hypothetical protein